jgi:hypothetical protein
LAIFVAGASTSLADAAAAAAAGPQGAAAGPAGIAKRPGANEELEAEEGESGASSFLLLLLAAPGGQQRQQQQQHACCGKLMEEAILPLFCEAGRSLCSGAAERPRGWGGRRGLASFFLLASLATKQSWFLFVPFSFGRAPLARCRATL